MSDVFISYRRADAGWARSLHDSLKARFPVFFDVEGIDAGDVFPEEIASALDECRVCCVLIGPEWVTPRQMHRLADEGDWVRREILTALNRQGVRVVPLLVGGAGLPRQEDLPEALRPLLARNVFTLSHEKWASDCAELIRRMAGWLSTQAIETANRGDPPPVLPFLCDRVPQEEGLEDWIASVGHRHPVCIVHGYMLEAHEGFLDRLNHRRYLDALFGSEEVGVAVCRLDWNREKARAGLYADLLKRALRRDAMGRLLATDEALRDWLANPGQPRILIMQVTGADLRELGEALLAGVVEAWHALFEAREPAWPQVLWINVSYDRIDQTLPTGGLEGVLPKLGPIGQGHVQEWLGKDEVRRFALGEESEILALTQDAECCFEPGKLHMQDFADAVRDILSGAR